LIYFMFYLINFQMEEHISAAFLFSNILSAVLFLGIDTCSSLIYLLIQWLLFKFSICFILELKLNIFTIQRLKYFSLIRDLIGKIRLVSPT